MSSENNANLSNRDFVPRYEQLLNANLPPSFTRFSEFFSGLHRLETLAEMLARHVDQRGLQVLNIGSGPFASEIFIAPLQDQQITAVDYTPEFEPFYQIFRGEGYLRTTTFHCADAMQMTFAPAQFDLIILHDVLYEPALDLEKMVARYQTFLKPNGLIFVDFVNSRTRWIWRLLRRPKRFRRYDPRAVRRFLSRQGLQVLEWRPTHRSKNPLVSAFHILLWYVFRASNNYAFLARNKAGPT